MEIINNANEVTSSLDENSVTNANANKSQETDQESSINTNTVISLENNDLPLMEGEIFIEEITRNHKLIHRHRVNKNNITIGRDYHNDIILSDPYVCPKHLSLSYSQGLWQLNDHDSINGSQVEVNKTKNKKPAQQAINDGDVIVLGKSQLRIVFKSHHVAETIAFSPFEHIIDFIRHPMAVITTIAVFMLIAAYNTYLNQTTETNISQLFVGAFSKTLLFAMWPASVALISQLTKNDPRILAQLGISFTFYVLIWLVDSLEEIIRFNSASNSWLDIVSTLLAIGMAFSLFWLNSYIGFHASAKRRMVVALSITLLLFGGSYLLQYSKQPEFDPHPRYNATIMGPSYLFTSSNNVDDFIKESHLLFDQATKAAQEKQKSD